MASFYESARTQMTGSDGAADTIASPPPSSKTSPFVLIVTLVLLPCLIAYQMVTGNEAKVIAIALAAVGGLLIIARPFWGLIFFVGLLYTRPEESIVALQGTRLPLMVSCITLLAMCFQKMLNRESLVKTPLNVMILGFGMAAVASVAATGQGSVSGAAMEVARLVILVFLVLNLVTTPQKYRVFSTTLVMFTGYLALYSIYLYFNGAAMVEHDKLRSQATGIFNDPNDLAGTIVPGLGMSLFRIRTEKNLSRLLYVASSAIFVAAIVLTHSRGGLMALFVVLGFFIFVSVRRKGVAVLIAVLAMLPLLALSGGHATNFDAKEESANSRFWFWTNGVEHLIQRPLLGIGYGVFPDINGGMTAHNSFVLCATETGFIGYFFWMGCLYYSFRRFVLPKTEEDESQRWEGIASNFPRLPNLSTVPSTKINNALELLGGRLGLAGFLVSGFWISRAYVPVLFLFIALPIVQQISAQPHLQKITLTSKERSKDWGWIALICFGSIAAIYLFALRSR